MAQEAEKYGQERGPGSRGHQHLEGRWGRHRGGSREEGCGFRSQSQRTGTFRKGWVSSCPRAEDGEWCLLSAPPPARRDLESLERGQQVPPARVLDLHHSHQQPAGAQSASVVETQVSRAGWPAGGGAGSGVGRLVLTPGSRLDPADALFQRGPQAGESVWWTPRC